MTTWLHTVCYTVNVVSQTLCHFHHTSWSVMFLLHADLPAPDSIRARRQFQNKIYTVAKKTGSLFSYKTTSTNVAKYQ